MNEICPLYSFVHSRLFKVACIWLVWMGLNATTLHWLSYRHEGRSINALETCVFFSVFVCYICGLSDRRTIGDWGWRYFVDSALLWWPLMISANWWSVYSSAFIPYCTSISTIIASVWEIIIWACVLYNLYAATHLCKCGMHSGDVIICLLLSSVFCYWLLSTLVVIFLIASFSSLSSSSSLLCLTCQDLTKV